MGRLLPDLGHPAQSLAGGDATGTAGADPGERLAARGADRALLGARLINARASKHACVCGCHAGDGTVPLVSIPANADIGRAALLLLCCAQAYRPEERPSFTEVVEELEDLMAVERNLMEAVDTAKAQAKSARDKQWAPARSVGAEAEAAAGGTNSIGGAE